MSDRMTLARQELARRELARRGQTISSIQPEEPQRKIPLSATPFLPKEEQVEKEIAGRKDSVTRLMEEYATPFDFERHPIKSALKPAVTLLKTAAVPFQRAESTVAGLGLGLQKGKPFEALSRGWKGLSGQEVSELGDIVRTTGFGGALNEPLASATGLFSSVGLTNIATKGKLVNAINKRMPKVMNDKWITDESRRGLKVTDQIDDALGNAYNTIYSKVGKVKVDSSKVDDILLRSEIPDNVLSEINDLVGGRVDTVERAKAVADVLRKRVPQSMYLSGGTTGKGGLANVGIRSKSAIRAIKDIMDESIGSVDKNAANELRNLNKFAHDKVYPTMDRMRSIFGRREEIPKTEEVSSVYRGIFGKAAQRESLRSIPKTAKNFKQYISQDYANDLSDLLINSKQLLRNMNKFRARQITKGGLIGAAAIGAGYGVYGGISRGLREKFGQ